MRTAELYLQKFVTGRYSDIWNAPSTLKTDADLIDFDFQSLFANKNNVVANAQMLLVFRFIEQEVINAREKNKGGANLHTLIIADEAHLYIDPKFPIALDFFYSMSKRKKKHLSVVLVEITRFATKRKGSRRQSNLTLVFREVCTMKSVPF